MVLICLLTSVCKEAILAHNFLRNVHQDTPTVTWNEEMASRAQAFSEGCASNGRTWPIYNWREFLKEDGETYFISSTEHKYLIANACMSW